VFARQSGAYRRIVRLRKTKQRLRPHLTGVCLTLVLVPVRWLAQPMRSHYDFHSGGPLVPSGRQPQASPNTPFGVRYGPRPSMALTTQPP